jgi:NTE family protein
MTSEEFKGWAKGVIDPEYVYYYKKDPNDPSWISVPIEISPKKFKPKLPTNLVLPYEMDFQFIRIFADAGAAANYNFDSLLYLFDVLLPILRQISPTLHVKAISKMPFALP